MIKIRLIGSHSYIEMVTRVIRELFTVVEEQDYPAREPGQVRRYLTVVIEGEQNEC